MATAIQVLTLKAMSRASGYGAWSQTRGSKSRLIQDHKVSGGSGWEWHTDTTPAKVRLYTHDPKQELGRQMMFASLSDHALYEKGLKYRWYAWQPGEECMSQTFTAAWVEKIKNGGNKLMIGDSQMGCEFCRQEPLVDAGKVPTQMSPEGAFGSSQTTWEKDSIPPKMSVAELRKALEEAERAEAEVTAPALTEESRAAVEPVGAPMEPTDIPSAPILQSTPPAAITLPDGPTPAACPVCERTVPRVAGPRTTKPGKALSEKQISQAYRKHIESQLKQGEAAHIEWYATVETPQGVPV